MKKLDFKNPDNIVKFQKILNETMEQKIREAKTNSALNSINDMSLGQMVSIFENISDKIVETEKGRELLRKYVKTITENKDLLKSYKLRSAILNPVTDNSVSFLNEALSISEISNAKKYGEGKKKLSRILKEMVNLAKLSYEDIEKISLNESELQNAIEYLMTNKKTFKNLSEYVSNKSIVENYVAEHMKNTSISEETQSTSELMSELSESLSSLNGLQRRVMTEIVESRLARKEDSELFEAYKNDCLSAMREKISESDDDGEVSKLKIMEQQLSEKAYSKDDFVTDLMNLSELKEILSE